MGDTTTTDTTAMTSPPPSEALMPASGAEPESLFEADLNGRAAHDSAEMSSPAARSEPIIVRQQDDLMESSNAAPAEATTEAAVASEQSQNAPREPSWTYSPDPALQQQESTELVYVAPMFGPTGRRRSPMLVALLSVITLGLYSVLLHYSWNGEMSDFDARLTVRPGRSTWAVTLPWLAGVAATVVGAATVIVSLAHVSLPFTIPISTTVGWVLIFGLVAVPYIELLFPLSAVALVMTAERIRVVEDRVGTGTDVQVKPTRSVCWLLLPVIGGLVMLTRLQTRLNGAWVRVAPAASSHSHR